MRLSDNFSKFESFTELYKLGIHKKIVTQKNLPLKAFATSTLGNSIERRALHTW